MDDLNRKLIGKRLKERREDSKLTQEEIGNRIGRKFTTVANYESGEIKNIDVMIISTIADMTNTNIDYLLLKSDDPNRNTDFMKYKHLNNTLIGRVSNKVEKMNDEELDLLDKLIDKIIKEEK